MPVRRRHHAPAVVRQVCHRVQELFLKDALGLEEVDVVDQQCVDAAEAMTESWERLIPQRLCEVVGEALRRNQHNLHRRLRAPQLPADAFQ